MSATPLPRAADGLDATPPMRPARRRSATWGRLIRQPKMIWGLLLTGLVLFVAFLGPVFAPHDPNQIIAAPFQPPSSNALLGTDFLGRDVLSRVLYGGRTVVWMATAATVLGMLIGISIGLFAGYRRGRAGALAMRAMDALQAFPQIVLVLLFISILGAKLWLIVLLVAVAWIPQVARVTQGITQEVAERDYILAQETIGTPTVRILGREILPNLASPLLVDFALRLTWSVGLIAGLSFLGFGITPPTADWGRMINENRAAIAVQPWGVAAPIICIGVLTIGITLIAEALSSELSGAARRGGAK